MSGISGRIKLALLCTIGLVVILALGLHDAGFTWGQTSAARSAVLATLQSIPKAPPPQTMDAPGREASVDEAAALDRTVNGFLEALRGGKPEAAYELLAKTNGKPNQDQWTEGFAGLKDEHRELRAEEFMGAFGGHKARLVDLQTMGGAGVCQIAVDASGDVWLALVKQNGAWLLDMAGTDAMRARQDVSAELDQLSQNTMDSFFRMMMSMETGAQGLPLDYLALLAVSPQSAQHQIAGREVDGDRAFVKLQTHGEINLVLGLKRTASGWALDPGSTCRMVAPDYKLAMGDIGTTGGSGSSQRQVCLSNLKQLALGMLQYCQDYDEKYAPANQWTSNIEPYVKNTQIFQCPAVPGKYGYAMNYKLSRAVMAQINAPATTIMLFDSTLLVPNAYDAKQMPGASLPVPGRHEGYNNFAFSDGHCSASSMKPPSDYYRLVRGADQPLPALPANGAPPPPPPPAAGGG